MLPAMIAPGTNLLGGQKAPNGTGRERRQTRSSSHVACQCYSTPGKWGECSTEIERGLPLRRTLSPKFLGAKVRHHFHALDHFITTDHFSTEKTPYGLPFILWLVPLLERNEPGASSLDRTLSPKFDDWV